VARIRLGFAFSLLNYSWSITQKRKLMLLEHYPDEKSEALAHLDFAIKEFREMKMQPYLEQALRHKQILGA